MIKITQMEEENTRAKKLIERIVFAPVPQSLQHNDEYIDFPKEVSIFGLNQNCKEDEASVRTLTDTLNECGRTSYDFNGSSEFIIQFTNSGEIENKEGYELEIGVKGIRVVSSTATGKFYAVQTIRQIMTYCFFSDLTLKYGEKSLPEGVTVLPVLKIEDYPMYELRSFMIDPGRAPFTMPLIKRVIRMMASLKMNLLHIGMYNDQLCGFRFENLPLGSENPFALTADDLKEIVAYARTYHISVMPELQSWGHVRSIIYHYPELYGCPGMWGGSSFGIGKKTFELLEKIYDEIVPLLEDETHLHVGMDEAIWHLLPGAENEKYTPVNLVTEIHSILQKVAKKHNKKVRMHLWADHGGRPIDETIKNDVVIEPWKYREIEQENIVSTMAKYGGEDKTPVMMGAGASSVHLNGAYEATRIWSEEGLKYPNVLGATLCLWETNDIAGNLVTLYGGAQYLWSENAPKRSGSDYLGEDLRNNIDVNMREWQNLFKDGLPELINEDRGPEVNSGRYRWHPNNGKAVAPTVDYDPAK